MTEHDITGETTVNDEKHRFGASYWPCRCGAIFWDPQSAANHSSQPITFQNRTYKPAQPTND